MHSVIVVRPEIFRGFERVECIVSTRLGGVSPKPFGMNLSFSVGDDRNNVERNRELFFRVVNADPMRVSYTKQCHSQIVHPIVSSGTYEACDGFVTAQRSLWLAVSIADCVPIFLFDPKRAAVAAIHAGWRGTRSGIARNGLQVLQEQFRSNPADVLTFVGPSAGVCCYEVREDVAEFFSNGVIRRQNGKVYLNLKEANKRQLVEMGVSESNIEVHPDCTICKPELYHSFRRDGERSGRMLGMIAIN